MGFVREMVNMKKIYYFLIVVLAFIFVLPGRVSAQGMMDFGTTDTKVNQNLSDDEYEQLGKQRMELIMGDNHEAADEQMIGGDGHVRLL